MSLAPSDNAKLVILERIDVREVLDKLGLAFEEKRDGLWLCCPWHDEKTPSFVVAWWGPAKATWRCYGCKKQKEVGGGIVALVVNVLKPRRRFGTEDGELELDWNAGWRFLADLAGVSLDPVASAREGRVEARVRLDPKVPAPVARPRLQLPAGATPALASEAAMAYLRHRGLTDEQVDRHELLWWEDRRRIVLPTVVEGVLRTWDARAVDVRCVRCRRSAPAWLERKGGPCPCGGAMRDLAPKTFGASLEEGADPGGALFGFDWIPPRSKRVFATEGPWGKLHIERQLGLPATALRGSILTERQAELLGRFPEVVVVPDGDAAGSLLERRLGPLVRRTKTLLVDLPPRSQPDDHDGEALEGLVYAARTPHLIQRPTTTVRFPAWK